MAHKRPGATARATRQVAAAKRQEAAKDRTPEQQLAQLNKYGFTATRERARLESRIYEAQKAEQAARKARKAS